MSKESKYCSELIKKHFNQQLVMPKEDNEDFNIPSKCWTATMIILTMMLK